MKWLLLACLAVLLVVPTALAAREMNVDLAWESAIWNAEVSMVPEPGQIRMAAWIPAGARLHDIRVEPAAPVSWRAAGPDIIDVTLGPNVTRLILSFDYPATALFAAHIVVPETVDAFTVAMTPPPEHVPRHEGLVFAEAEGRHVATVANVPRDSRFDIRIVDPSRVGEVPLLLTIGGLAGLLVVGAMAYHRIRPPLAGRAPARFLDHLSELQARLVPPVIVFALLNVFYFIAGLATRKAWGITWIVPTFGIDASLATRGFDAFAERMVPAGVSLVVLRPIDAILAQVQVTLFLAFVTVLPMLLYEIVAFIGPGLEPKERRAAMRIIPLILVLFLAGGLVGYLVMAPLMIETLYAYAPGIGATAFLVVADLVSFALMIVAAFGLAFELPVGMYALSRVGVVKAATFRRYFRHAVVVIFLVAGIITPDPSIVSQVLVGAPVTLLYVLGILAASAGERARAPTVDV